MWRSTFAHAAARGASGCGDSVKRYDERADNGSHRSVPTAVAAPRPDPDISPTGTVASSSAPVPDRDGADGTNDHDAAAAAVTHAFPPRCKARTRLYRNGGLQAEGFPATELSDHLRDDGATVWLDLYDPEIDDLAVITEEFGLHPLAVEDAVHDHERPKLDRYRDHLFLSAYAVRLDLDSGELTTHELAAFVTPTALITVRKDNGFDIDGLVKRWDDNPDLAAHGVAFLLHGLLDDIVDGHFAAVQTLDGEIEDLQDLMFADTGPHADLQRRSFELRKSLVLLRRVVLPMRELVNTLMRRDLHVLDPEMTPYYQDVYDHVLRATEWTESLRDLVSTILETRITLQGNQLNEVMKKLTSWAAIIAIPTAVTGFYGQNVPYPGFQQQWGFLSSIVLILGLGLALYLTFKKKGWL
jgi:magnesium transporter